MNLNPEQTVIRGIVAIDAGDTGRITPEQAREIAALFSGDGTLFYNLDSGPGRYRSPFYHGGDEDDYTYDSWHWKLRQARNTRGFFDAFNGRA